MVTKTTTKKTTAQKSPAKRLSSSTNSQRFEPAKLDSLFVVLDAIAWLDAPSNGQVAQFAGIDPRTAGKLLKNACQIGMVDSVGSGYALVLPYPYKGSKEQKEAVVKEALVRLPLLTGVRQFLRLGDKTDVALRKAATIAGITPFVPADINPLLEWAQSLGALQPTLIAEDLVDAAESKKEQRHKDEKGRRIAFLSHSSIDKPFIRQLAADLTANGVDVWLDEQRIRVGDSIPEKIAQGLAGSDFFLIGMSGNSANSPWVQKELNNALVNEVQRRKVHILPLKLDDSPMPQILADKKYADFSKSYKAGLDDLLNALKGDV
ncbi:toll/interleukin-1 receptor domain-containing protein [Paraburkholderia susongensis]|uniref:TIR domain-containing protein n=1 Tax=Paraburkholderia susongensis TaxID=1515439 RepID=A0A1X7IRW7_9BURK|nr:toll/interleukin-1 receptor domain-containing protein [Paraburkholderia susongensis]SMG17745.1 TIR domain-containing protein [Paraburkholderia susongensis]